MLEKIRYSIYHRICNWVDVLEILSAWTRQLIYNEMQDCSHVLWWRSRRVFQPYTANDQACLWKPPCVSAPLALLQIHTSCQWHTRKLLVCLLFGTASKLTSFPDHFLPNCFQFLVLYTVYSSGLVVLYLSHSKQLQHNVMYTSSINSVN